MALLTLRWTTCSALIFAALAFVACSQGPSKKNSGGGGAKQDVARRAPSGGPAKGARPGGPALRNGPAIEVTWEALAHERYLQENSRFKRRGPQPPQRITLLNTSHPNAERARVPRTRAEREKYVNTAVLSDRDMLSFVQGLRRNGFYRYARPTVQNSAAYSNSNARGRVTVDHNGTSRTLVSMRGQGLNESTKAIPRLYSEAKQAIMVLRNMTPTLNVRHQGVDPLRR